MITCPVVAVFTCLTCTGVVVNAAIVAGKALPRPAVGVKGTGKIRTYLGSISIQRDRCFVTVSPLSITVEHRSLPWSRNVSVSCGQRGHFRVDIVAGRQVLIMIILLKITMTWLFATFWYLHVHSAEGQHTDANIWSILIFIDSHGVAKDSALIAINVKKT